MRVLLAVASRPETMNYYAMPEFGTPHAALAPFLQPSSKEAKSRQSQLPERTQNIVSKAPRERSRVADPHTNHIFFAKLGRLHAQRAAFELQLKAATKRKFSPAPIGQRTDAHHKEEPCPDSTS